MRKKPNSILILRGKEYPSDYLERKEYFKKAGVDFNEIYVSEEIEKDAMQIGKTVAKISSCILPRFDYHRVKLRKIQFTDQIKVCESLNISG